jgi:hypothetical protein
VCLFNDHNFELFIVVEKQDKSFSILLSIIWHDQTENLTHFATVVGNWNVQLLVNTNVPAYLF